MYAKHLAGVFSDALTSVYLGPATDEQHFFVQERRKIT